MMLRGAAAVVLAALLLIGWGVVFTYGQENPNCSEFGFQIQVHCCCTSDCCREAREGEFQHMGGDRYRSVETGQVIQRTGWSPDGRTIKCACDLIEGKWTKHPKANVRCLFLPMPSS